MSKSSSLLKIGLFVLLAGGVCAGIFALRHQRPALQARLGTLQHENEPVVRLRDENQKSRALLVQAQRGEDAAAQLIHAELVQTRTEIARLEKIAEERHREIAAKITADENALEDNRDPEKGQMKLEYCKDVGRATPVAALQTLVWAAMTGHDDVLASGLGLDDAAQKKAAMMLSLLPEDARAQFPSVDKLASLAFTDLVLEQVSMQVVKQKMNDADHATLTVVRGNNPKEVQVPMQRDAQGWRLVMPEGAMNGLKKKLSRTAVDGR